MNKKYYVLSYERSGGHYLCSYLISYRNKYFPHRLNDFLVNSEICSNRWDFTNGDNFYSSGQGVFNSNDFFMKNLIFFKDNIDIYHPIKILPKYLDNYSIDMVLNFIKNDTLIFLKRNKFDRFLSFIYAHKTNWINAQKINSIVKKIYVDENDIKFFMEREIISYKNSNIILKNHHNIMVIDYDDLNDDYLKYFLNVEEPIHKYKKLNIDYSEKIINYKQILKSFNKINNEYFS